MAIRALAPKIRSAHRLRRFVRPVNVASTALPAVDLTAADAEQNHRQPEIHALLPPPPQFPSLSSALTAERTSRVLDLGDAEKLFSNVRSAKLLKSSATLQMAAIDPLVDVGMLVMNSKMLDMPVLRNAILGVVRRTFYEQFCAGEDREEMGRTVRRLWDSGIRSMLVYGVEDVDDNASCDRNFQGFLDTVQYARTLPPSSASFVIVKITAICPMKILQRVSHLLRWEHKVPSLRLPWKHNTLPIFSDSSPLYHTSTKPDPLTPEEEHDLQLALHRFTRLCRSCSEAHVPLTVDAEYTTVQPAIDYLTYSAALVYNRGGHPVVFNTIQAYLKDAKERLVLATEAAERMGVKLGIKLVRGAYMSSEARVASSLGSVSPVHDSIQDTHDCYNDCASFMLERIAEGRGDAVVLATHNVESGELAASRALELGIGKDNVKLQFAQLYGMSEALSLCLKNAGFVVSKYMPFGPIDEVLPYLLRRAEENRGMLATSALDRTLMAQELKRRLKQLFRPVGGPGAGRGTRPAGKLGDQSAYN